MFPREFSIEEMQRVVRDAGGRPDREVRSQGWEFVFVLRSDGTSIGRLTFRDGILTNVKCYKQDYIKTVCETDFIFLRLDYYLQTGGRDSLSRQDVEDLRRTARRIVDGSTEASIVWRVAHPTVKKRKALKGMNVRVVMRRLVSEKISTFKYQSQFETTLWMAKKDPDRSFRVELSLAKGRFGGA